MDKELEALAEAIAQRVQQRANKPKPKLVLVPKTPAPSARSMDDVERESRIRWMLALAKAYRPLDLIVKRAMIGKRYMSDLSDDELMDLHRDIDRGHECLSDGIPFEDAGLLRLKGFQ